MLNIRRRAHLIISNTLPPRMPLLITLHNRNRIATEEVNISTSKLARRDFILEQDVQLAIGTAFGLRKTEEDPDDADETGAGPEEAAVGAPVPGCGRELVVCDYVYDDAADVVEVAGEDDGFGFEAC